MVINTNRVNNKVLTPKEKLMGYDEHNNKNEWYEKSCHELHIL